MATATTAVDGQEVFPFAICSNHILFSYAIAEPTTTPTPQY